MSDKLTFAGSFAPFGRAAGSSAIGMTTIMTIITMTTRMRGASG